MSAGPWSTSKLKGYRERGGAIERQCLCCAAWFSLDQLAKDPKRTFGRVRVCKPCHNARTELNKARREERQALARKKRSIGAGLARLRKAVLKAEREREAG